MTKLAGLAPFNNTCHLLRLAHKAGEIRSRTHLFPPSTLLLLLLLELLLLQILMCSLTSMSGFLPSILHRCIMRMPSTALLTCRT
jgi:hypothetical protein